MNDEQFRKVSDAEPVFLESLVTGDPSGSIERQEERAQRSMVGGARLPKSFPHWVKITWEQVCAAWGMTIDGSVDDLFNNVTLPEGWKIEATDHSMWTKLVDDKGRQRASIFYKGAFYDRSAHISLTVRYGFVMDYDSDKPNRIVQVIDRGQGPEEVIIHVVGKSERKDDQDYSWEVHRREEELFAIAKAWLEEKFPGYSNPLAYW